MPHFKEKITGKVRPSVRRLLIEPAQADDNETENEIETEHEDVDIDLNIDINVGEDDVVNVDVDININKKNIKNVKQRTGRRSRKRLSP